MFTLLFLAWSREIILEKWMADPVTCCENMGLETPLSAFRLLSTSLEYLQVGLQV